jgi:2-oxo-4-hydroxy-4-carboxy-5-ureidoimidazoline decarboxylase
MTLGELNLLSREELVAALIRCCGSTRWAELVSEHTPFGSATELHATADASWNECSESDFKEAFSHHPRIGQGVDPNSKSASTAGWAAAEQSSVKSASSMLLQELADLNESYLNKFGYIFIICATGRSAEEMKEALVMRLNNDPADEIRNAAEEQRKIMHIRISKLIE